VPPRLALVIGALDLGVAAVAGVLVSLLLAVIGRETTSVRVALGLGVVFALLRIYGPPGLGAEAAFLVVGAAAAIVAAWIVGAGTGALAGVHVTLLVTAATVLVGFMLDEGATGPLTGMRVPILFAALLVAVTVADRIVALAVRARGRRLVLELGAAAVALAVLARPFDPAPLDDALVTGIPPPAGTPDVILISLDTTRADHLSTYGYARDTSPALTAFAADALRFTQARSPSAWTLPGHASMLTGQYPGRHGARLAGGWLPGRGMDGRRRVAFPLPAQAVTLTETLRDRGYQTGAFVANFSYLYRDFGLVQGFGRYDDAPGVLLRVRPHVVRFAQRFDPSFCLKPYRSAREINAAALAWLDRASPARPVFLFLNYLEPHQPWLAPPPYDRWSRALPNARRLAEKNLYTHEIRPLDAAERDFIVANYDGQVALMDAALGELLEALRARGRYENTLVIITSDHGEFLGEHGQLGHIGRMLYEPLLHIPLVVKFPGPARARGVSDTPVQLVDIFPTVAGVAGAPLPPGIQGETLTRVTHASMAEEEINPFLVSRYGEVYNRGIRVYYDGTYKLISTSRGEHKLFDLARDPGEVHDLAAREPERVSALRAQLEAALAAQSDTTSRTTFVRID
jgi:arylsulfatase A-like enzyme